MILISGRVNSDLSSKLNKVVVLAPAVTSDFNCGLTLNNKLVKVVAHCGSYMTNEPNKGFILCHCSDSNLEVQSVFVCDSAAVHYWAC